MNEQEIIEKEDDLQSEITENLKSLRTDGYKMSIGEIASLYKDQEIVVNPEFQRYFRWSEKQKSRFIESILLEIPIPPIYVSELDNNRWEVIDGLQRISTILQFMGVLKDPDPSKGLYPPLRLESTKLLPSLEGYVWEKVSSDADTVQFPGDLKVKLKRQHLSVEIIKRGSDVNQKYELFQRLNTLGSKLSDQEVRNCLMIMLNRDFYLWFFDLAQNKTFLSLTSLSDKQLIERDEMELILRLLVMVEGDADSWTGEDLHDVLTNEMINISNRKDFNREEFEDKLVRVFSMIEGAIDEGPFKRYHPSEDRFKGSFLTSAFEGICYGIMANLSEIESTPNYNLADKIKGLWSHKPFEDLVSKRGLRAVDRMKSIIPVVSSYF